MRILLGMSGGIDSTFAALKMINEGHEVVGAILKMHEYTDLTAARTAAARLAIPLVEIDCTDRFEERVKSYFVNEYTHARTPNPCIVCNREVKFRCLYDYAVAHGFDRIATGHYARIVTRTDNGVTRYAVASARDLSKDQTYMLYSLPEEILSYLYFPLADELKCEVTQRAEAAGIIDHGTSESQEICFIPDNDYRSYIERRVGKFPEGSFIDTTGKVLGTHKGIIGYTVGQRKGLGISLGERAFVSHINPKTNEITLSTGATAVTSLGISDIVFSGASARREGDSLSALVKVRYHARPVSATLTFTSDSTATVTLDEPVASVAPGQSLVAYDGDTVLLGGFIDS